jgi:cell division protein FtsB
MQIKIDHQKYLRQATAFLQKMSDIRFAGQVVFVVIVLLISWSGIKSIQTNYGLQRQIAGLTKENELKKLENDNLALQNEYFNSKQYLELAARQNFGLAAPGEKEIVVPEAVALSRTVDIPKLDPGNKAEKAKPGYQRNFESWVNFFLHRQEATR